MKNKQPDQQEFLRRVNESQGIIHKVCRLYCNDEEHRKDLFQEILIHLWKSYPSFRGDAQFSSWMYRVALNVAIQDFRKVKKKKLLFIDAYEFKELSGPPDSSELENEKFRMMYEAIGRLDKLDKAIMLLHLDGEPNEEIGKIVGITTNYVRVKMNRIKKKLSENIKKK